MGTTSSDRRRSPGENLEEARGPSTQPLLWHNGYFGRGRRTVIVRGGFTAVNSPLFQNAEVLDEILKYAYIPREVVKAYRDQASAEKGPVRNRQRRAPVSGE